MDSKEINKKLGNAVKFSYGFLDGIDIGQIEFNTALGLYVAEAFNNYVDAKARMNPAALHHVYEWGQVGNSGGRLFTLTPKSSKRVIHFTGKFLPSSSIPEGGSVPFRDKANIMENGIGVTIEPTNGVLAFDDNGETVFTATAVYVAHPGGDAVAGSFAEVVESFFGEYLTGAILAPFLKQLANPKEFAQAFPAGTKSGRGPGVKAGVKYMESAGVDIE
jgi:hypothetical protein